MQARRKGGGGVTEAMLEKYSVLPAVAEPVEVTFFAQGVRASCSPARNTSSTWLELMVTFCMHIAE